MGWGGVLPLQAFDLTKRPLGTHPTPLGAHTVMSPLGNYTHFPITDTPWAESPQVEPLPPRESYCSGRYASYWNVILQLEIDYCSLTDVDLTFKTPPLIILMNADCNDYTSMFQ